MNSMGAEMKWRTSKDAGSPDIYARYSNAASLVLFKYKCLCLTTLIYICLQIYECTVQFA
jgi:hypothetical protein